MKKWIFWGLIGALIGCNEPTEKKTQTNITDSTTNTIKKQLAQNDALLKVDSLNHDLWYQRALLFEQLKDTLSAIKYYRYAIKVFATPQAMLALANLMAEQKNSDALIICSNIALLFPANELKADLHFIKGIFYARSQQTNQAIAQFDSCITERYRYLEAYMEKGFILFDRAQFKMASTIFETTVKIDPLYADGYYWMAKCAEKTNQHTEAINNYQKALTLDPLLKEAAEAINRLQ